MSVTHDGHATQDWLDWRRGGLGGSDVAAIRGNSKWSTPWDVWLAKTTGTDRDLSNDADAQTGHLLEEAVIRWAAMKLGADVLATNTREQHPDEPVMRGTPDAWMSYQGGARFGFEAKVRDWPGDEWGPDEFEANPFSHALTLLGEARIAADCKDQVAWYMATTESPIWWLAVFFRGPPEWRLYGLARDAAFESELVPEALGWWREHVELGEPPPIDDTGACSRGLRALYGGREDTGGLSSALRVATPDEVALVAEYADCDRALKRLERTRRGLANRIRAAVGDAPGLRWTGGRIRVSSRLTYNLEED